MATILLAIASLEIVSCDAASARIADRADASGQPSVTAGPVPEDGGIEGSTGATANAFDASPFATVDANNDATADSGAVTMADSSPAGTVDATIDADPTENADASPDADAGAGSSASTEPDASDGAVVDAMIEATADVRDAVAAASDAEGGLADAGDAAIDDPYGYSEATNGNFSSVNTAPTAVRVRIGSSFVTGVVGGGSADGQFDDYFEIVVPAGAALTSIVLTQDVSTSGTGDYTFFAVATGTSISGSETTAAGMLGWVLFYPGMIGTDLLPTMGQAGNGATGFSPPLGPGAYSFRVQDNDGSNAVTYQLKLVLSAQ